MSVEGVWKVEMLGPYGWEKISTAFLLDGKYLGASADHHSVGVYREDGGQISMQARVTQHGKLRTIFGETKKQLDMHIDAKEKKSGKIVGLAHPAENRDFEVRVRLVRLQKLG